MNWRDWMSGHQTGPTAAILRTAASVAAGGYAAAMRLRNRRYDRGRNVHVAGVPVISVGNLTTGGTGKTPLVAEIATWIRSLDRRVTIVSRGYGTDDRAPGGYNDEALELMRRLPDVPHVQDADRVAAARIAVEELAAEVLIMDDGFQHRRLHRDLDIVVIDATCPFGYGHCLPRGLLREPVSGLSRADVVVITRIDRVTDDDLERIETTIRRHTDAPIDRCRHAPTTLRHAPTTLRHADGRTEPAASLSGRRVHALSAIGNPDAFVRSLQTLGATIVGRTDLPDHAAYDESDLAKIKLSNTPELIVVTGKDAVKLSDTTINAVPWAALEIDVDWESPPALRALVEEVARSDEGECAGRG